MCLYCQGDDPCVKVPFILLPSCENEGQFAFTISSIDMPQKLKGTLTYIIKVSATRLYSFRWFLSCCAARYLHLHVSCWHFSIVNVALINGSTGLHQGLFASDVWFLIFSGHLYSGLIFSVRMFLEFTFSYEKCQG